MVTLGQEISPLVLKNISRVSADSSERGHVISSMSLTENLCILFERSTSER